MTTKLITSEEDLERYAATLLPLISAMRMIGLRGDLGAGKTTFVRGLLRAMDYTVNVKSPTYGLFETYDFADLSVAHFDLYRLSDPDELEFIGFADFIAADMLCLIEWPEKGGKWTANMDLEIQFDFADRGRKVSYRKF